MKSSQLQIRVSEEEKRIIRREAKLAGQDVSSWVLGKILPKKRLEFQNLIKELSEATQEEQSFVLASLNDYLFRLPPSEFQNVLRELPSVKLSQFLINYVAAMIEQSAMLKEINAPAWVREIPPLDIPVFSSKLESLRLHLLLDAPVVFKKRNIFIDSTIGNRV